MSRAKNMTSKTVINLMNQAHSRKKKKIKILKREKEKTRMADNKMSMLRRDIPGLRQKLSETH